MATQITKIKSKPVYYKALSISPTGEMVNTDSRTIKGYAAVFGNKDSDCDILIKGAFAKSINERGPASTSNRKVIMLWQHDMDEPLGRITTLKEDDYGLYFEAELDKIPEADRTLEQLKSGTLNQFSIGYRYVWDKMEYDADADAYVVKEVELFEISVVSIGCNEMTYFLGMKSEEMESEQNKLNRDTEKVIKQLPTECQYKVRQLISKHIALAETEPGKPTPEIEPQKKGLIISIGSKI